MDVFALHNNLITDYADFVQSFIRIRDYRIADYVKTSVKEGLLWPEPLIQLNPSFATGGSVNDLVASDVLHPLCAKIFRLKPEDRDLRLHRHQVEAIRTAQTGGNYVLTTGTGSGKSLSYIVPIVDRVLKRGSGQGIQAIIVYPMNALANSQLKELEKFLQLGFDTPPVTFQRYTGQESEESRQRIRQSPPDILLTNYVMLELLLTRHGEQSLVRAARGLQFLVLDELHTYRGRQGADVAMLIRRVRDAVNSPSLQCVGTSATMASGGTRADQQREVARVASTLFGSSVLEDAVIGETLRRATPVLDFTDPTICQALRQRVSEFSLTSPVDYDAFVNDPLSSWIEGKFGVRLDGDRLVRQSPRGITGELGAAVELSALTGFEEARCAEVIREGLLGGYKADKNPETGFPAFAFKLHQFISRGDAVFASLDSARERYLTVNGQRFVPGDSSRAMLPLAFCRECGHEYYTVSLMTDSGSGVRFVTARDVMSHATPSGGDAGFLYRSDDKPWIEELEEIQRRVPDDWFEERDAGPRLKSDRKAHLPRGIYLDALGKESADGSAWHFVAAPFRFCLCCGVSYSAREKSDFAKLGTLGSEGRSTATTILSLSAIRHLRNSDLTDLAKKMLSFTDNRQDASLQAGHFNDFVEVGLLRSALYRAARDGGNEGLSHDELVLRVFDALELPVEKYSSDPSVRFQAKIETERALRGVLGYRVYRDLKRGWRINAPNLEQCGLLEIQYESLTEVCAAKDVWEGKHAALTNASVDLRCQVSKVLLDTMRRELAIKVSYLGQQEQERIKQQAGLRLVSPWALDDNELLEYAAVMYPRSRRPSDTGSNAFLSGRSSFGQYLRRKLEGKLTLIDTDTIIQQMLEGLKVAGLVEVVDEPRQPGDGVPGYQLNAASMRWVAGDGSKPFHDVLRRPTESAESGGTNTFFIDFYQTVAGNLQSFEAHEHTAQVPAPDRERREEDFRAGRLPVLYCSPTMELGVDISELNVVNMRNVPPTPANYAQRSGRAGRSGQPALVFTYCAGGSSHDQYFFKRPQKMVAGSVDPPRLDLGNEDLIRAHVQAIWLSESGISLGRSLKDVLNLEAPDLALPPLDGIAADLERTEVRTRALTRAKRILEATPDLMASDWYSNEWLERVMNEIALSFDAACNRWRELYRGAYRQSETQQRIILDASRTQRERDQAAGLRREAEAQLDLLRDTGDAMQSDFYSYRYFASEGFLPGYSFPRLPLSAFIPKRRSRQRDRDEFLSRPRFLAVSEFGPRSIIYHEGSKYVVNRVILPVGEQEAAANGMQLQRAKQCAHCGYLHKLEGGSAGPDLCESCRMPLPPALNSLLRLQNVSTRRRDKINSDEEERVRLGYEVKTAVRFADRNGQSNARIAEALTNGAPVLKLTYGHAATLWRINLGWVRRKNPEQLGFMIDRQGYWQRNELTEDGPDDRPGEGGDVRVVPYVEDRRNCLMLETSGFANAAQMISLLAALKNAIQVRYQLEDSELAAETLPSRDDPQKLLLYESAEGGAGVLRRLIDEPQALSEVARAALEICHFDPETGQDLHHAPGSKEVCMAACYDCLMSYGNQSSHALLDRHSIQSLLMNLAHATVSTSPSNSSRETHLEFLRRQTDSALERRWLDLLEARGHRLPERAQVLIPQCKTRPDFVFDGSYTVIYIDGPHHEFPERQARDRTQQDALEDAGYTVLRFSHHDDWDALLERHPSVFGASQR